MSFFSAPPKPEKPAPAAPTFTPPTKGHRGYRGTEDHTVSPVDVIVARKHGVRAGRAVVELDPDGCLFRVKGTPGFFDLRGFWCLPKADGKIKVTRGAPKAVMRLLTQDQRRALERVRLNARRHGLR